MDELDLKIIKGTEECVKRMYDALGMKPGEGGKLAPYLSGYEHAMRDVRAMLRPSHQQVSEETHQQFHADLNASLAGVLPP